MDASSSQGEGALSLLCEAAAAADPPSGCLFLNCRNIAAAEAEATPIFSNTQRFGVFLHLVHTGLFSSHCREAVNSCHRRTSQVERVSNLDSPPFTL